MSRLRTVSVLFWYVSGALWRELRRAERSEAPRSGVSFPSLREVLGKSKTTLAKASYRVGACFQDVSTGMKDSFL